MPLCRDCSLVALRPLIHANLVGTLHGGDAGYSQSFFSRVERSEASGGRVFRVEASGIVLKTVESGLVKSEQGEVALQQLEFWKEGVNAEDQKERRERTICGQRS